MLEYTIKLNEDEFELLKKMISHDDYFHGTDAAESSDELKDLRKKIALITPLEQ